MPSPHLHVTTQGGKTSSADMEEEAYFKHQAFLGSHSYIPQASPQQEGCFACVPCRVLYESFPAGLMSCAGSYLNGMGKVYLVGREVPVGPSPGHRIGL